MKPKFEIGQKVFYEPDYFHNIAPKWSEIVSIKINKNEIVYELLHNYHVKENCLYSTFEQIKRFCFDKLDEILLNLKKEVEND